MHSDLDNVYTLCGLWYLEYMKNFSDNMELHMA